jgi:hypothetical protein
MKMLKKLALVSAISMISAGSFAMEAMDEEVHVCYNWSRRYHNQYRS